MPEGNSSGYLVELDAVYNRSGTVDEFEHAKSSYESSSAIMD